MKWVTRGEDRVWPGLQSDQAQLHGFIHQPCLPPSLLGIFITRTPRSLVTLHDLLFPVPPYCRRDVVLFVLLFFFSHNRPGAHVSVFDVSRWRRRRRRRRRR